MVQTSTRLEARGLGGVPNRKFFSGGLGGWGGAPANWPMLAGLLPAKGMSRPPAGPPPVLAALAAGVGAFAVYAPTLNSITAGDSGELLNAAANWSVAHPPGYPLWT